MTRSASSDELADLLHLITHDFSSPVRAMVEFSKILEEEFAEQMQGDGEVYLNQIISNGNRMQAMLKALSELANIKKRRPDKVACPLFDCVEKAMDQLQAHPAFAHAKITVNNLPEISADPELITTLLVKLLENSLTYAQKEAPATIEITAQLADGQCILTITDNGIGISSDHHELVLKPFKRLHRSEDYPGTGMGLTIAHEIAKLHGGIFKFGIGNNGQGCQIQLLLPQ